MKKIPIPGFKEGKNDLITANSPTNFRLQVEYLSNLKPENMKSTYKIRTEKGEVLHQEKDLALKQNVFEEHQQDFQTDFADCNYKEIFLHKAAIIIRDDIINTPLFFDIKFDAPYIKVHFELEGDSLYTPNTNDGIDVKINKNEYNFFYLPKVDGTLAFTNPRKKSLEFVVSEDFLRSLFKSGFENISGDLGIALQEQKPFKLFEQSPAIPSNLMLIVNEIVHCSYQQEIKEVYLESKVKEVFSYLFSLIVQKESPKQEVKLSEYEHNQIVQIEQVLKEKLRNSLTIKELASLSGINETKLKRNFKLVTGKPIFSYLTDMRMEKARNMLINPEKSVSEVAYAVGYKNPQHFTSAFKRRFNYVPSDFRKSVQNAMS